jgi:hypothetical protein
MRCLQSKYCETHRPKAGQNIMRKIKLIAFVAVIAGIASVLVWQYQLNASLRDDNERLRQMLAELKQLSEVPAPAPADETFTDEQHSELIKLRSEVTRLRAQTNQIAVLAEANQKLQTSLREARTPKQPQTDASQKKTPEDALPQDIHPKESWAYRGYSTPDATILWAMLNGDKAAILKAFGPDMLPEMEKQMEGKNFTEQMKKINMTEFRVLDRRQISPDEMVLTISTARLDDNGNKVGHSQEDTVFDRIDGEWKATKKQAPGD